MNTRKGLLALLLGVAVLAIALGLSWPLLRDLAAPSPTQRDSSYSELRTMVAQGGIVRLTFYGEKSGAALGRDGVLYRAMLPVALAGELARDAAQRGVAVTFRAPEFLPYGSRLTLPTLLTILANVLLLAALAFFFHRFLGKGAGGGCRALLAKGEPGHPVFADVAGCESEKAELMEVVDFLKDPARYSRLGGRVPAGVLLSGPPGTGKTMLARAAAGEAGVPFIHLAGSDFVEMFVGVGAARVRSAFAKARKKAPCILFIDEIDAVGRSRTGGGHGGHEERDQTLNQLLVEMDGFKPNAGVIVIAATNRPEILDKALTRPGRFSRHVVLPPPDLHGRRRILDVHAGRLMLADDVDLAMVARGTPGFTGAELANLVNEAAIVGARRYHTLVTMADFDAARDRLLLGNERPALAIDEEDRRLTAIHEAGHAVVALHCPASDPIHKATILPRGQSLGMVLRLPDRDRPSVRRSRLEADLAVAMGGRAAELLRFGADEISTGASGDLRMASELARRMVTEWGMGAATVWHGGAESPPAWSERTAGRLDDEVVALVDAALARAQTILSVHAHQLDAIAAALLEREVLSGE